MYLVLRKANLRKQLWKEPRNDFRQPNSSHKGIDFHLQPSHLMSHHTAKGTQTLLTSYSSLNPFGTSCPSRGLFQASSSCLASSSTLSTGLNKEKALSVLICVQVSSFNWLHKGHPKHIRHNRIFFLPVLKMTFTNILKKLFYIIRTVIFNKKHL